MSVTDKERRRYPRQHLAGVVEYSGGEGVRCNEIINIGMGGVRLELTAAERPGTRVELRIALEQGEPITVVGQVVWARTREPFEAGIRFLEVDASKLEAAL